MSVACAGALQTGCPLNGGLSSLSSCRVAAGVSQAQFFDQFLGSIKLNAEPVDWSSQDLSYLEPVSSWRESAAG